MDVVVARREGDEARAAGALRGGRQRRDLAQQVRPRHLLLLCLGVASLVCLKPIVLSLVLEGLGVHLLVALLSLFLLLVIIAEGKGRWEGIGELWGVRVGLIHRPPLERILLAVDVTQQVGANEASLSPRVVPADAVNGELLRNVLLLLLAFVVVVPIVIAAAGIEGAVAMAAANGYAEVLDGKHGLHLFLLFFFFPFLVLVLVLLRVGELFVVDSNELTVSRDSYAGGRRVEGE